MPDPIPIGVLGRLAVAKTMQGKGVGAFLLQSAIRRALLGAEHLGLVGVLVHALDERAKAFYLHYGFQVSPIRPLTLAFSFKGVEL
jgi:GNAT superfamily N-acetyltransferase